MLLPILPIWLTACGPSEEPGPGQLPPGGDSGDTVPDETDAGDTGDTADTGTSDEHLSVTTPTGMVARISIDEDLLASVGLTADDLTIELVEIDAARDPAHALVQELAGAFLEVGPSGTEFPWPLRLELEVPAALLPSDRPRLGVGTWSEEQEMWEPLTVVVSGTDPLVIEAHVPHLSTFDVYATVGVPPVELESPLEPGGAGVIAIGDAQAYTDTGYLWVLNAAMCVAPGGCLVYAVCSPEPEEGPEVVAALGWTIEARFENAPCVDGADAFFAVRMRRPG